ncbi:hypothetical protein LINPERPRIM_LOCUS16274 [Linum perenne]
MCGSSSPVR